MTSKLTIAVLLLAAPLGFAQSPRVATDKPAFEVASVKINKSGDRRGSMDLQSPDRFVATNQPLPVFISFAYKVPPGKLSGGPAWMMTERFDISAKTDRKADTEQKMLMLRTLLEDRFKLKIRVETNEGPIFALVLARNDGRLGPNLRPTNADCVAVIEARRRGEALPPTTPPVTPKPGEPLPCGSAVGFYRARGILMSSFALTLGARTLQTVVDRTGLAGLFDFDLQASLEGLDLHRGTAPAVAGPDSPPSIFTALQEQLGLKLEPQRGPIETFVVESVGLPTPD